MTKIERGKLMIIDVELEEWVGSPVIRARATDYRRWPATKYADRPAKLTPRQATFYRNLIRIALAVQNRELPVDFDLPSGDGLYMDHGCVKIAEHAGFIERLGNGPSGTVEFVRSAYLNAGAGFPGRASVRRFGSLRAAVRARPARYRLAVGLACVIPDEALETFGFSS